MYVSPLIVLLCLKMHQMRLAVGLRLVEPRRFPFHVHCYRLRRIERGLCEFDLLSGFVVQISRHE